jgi:1,4-dihydroxy-2-naphthoate octaprenyltransferase
LAARPKTLPAAIAPVFLGTALVFQADAFHYLAAACALFGALALQIGTNLANDYFDARQGADTGERLGPPRVVAQGLLPAAAVWRATVGVFLLAAAFGLYLVLRGGWPIVLLGLTAIACGVLYTAGRWSLAYLGLGDLFAFLFFGPVAVAGTFYVQALTLSPLALWLGVVPGCYAVALIAINNLRDRVGDAAAGKHTLAVRFGERFARTEIIIAVLLPSLAPWFLPGVPTELAVIGSLVAIVAARPVVFPVWRGVEGRALNSLLARASAGNLCLCFLLGVFLIR